MEAQLEANPTQAAARDYTPASAGTLYDIPFRKADGAAATLEEHAGKVLLVVNVASKCGLTGQYDALEGIQEKFQGRGFTVVAFPSNDFGNQEPGSDAEIQEFCRLSYGVTFPVNAKITVKGPGQHPLYRELTRQAPHALERSGILRGKLEKLGLLGREGDITWNFEKFVVNRRGEVVARFAPDVVPVDPMVIEVIESELAG
jgi:glutathione peroxidase